MPAIMTKKLLSAPKVTVDYPQQNEVISSATHYTLRICAKEGDIVQVAIDQGPWKPCRQAVGYWWYDWSGYGDGEHEAVARIKTKKGGWTRSDTHEFFVKIRTDAAPKQV